MEQRQAGGEPLVIRRRLALTGLGLFSISYSALFPWRGHLTSHPHPSFTNPLYALAQLLELLLPRVNEMMEMPERTMVIDVGANVGFYSLLSASRGYDVVAVEPAHESVLRLLHSLAANGVKIARNGKDAGINSGHTRMPIAYVYENAASDVYNTAQLRYDSGNPGASWVEETETPRRAVTTGALRALARGPVTALCL